MHELLLAGDHLYAETCEVYAIALKGSGDRWLNATVRTSENEEPNIEVDFDLTPFRGSYCRVTVVDRCGQRAWSNPIRP